MQNLPAPWTMLSATSGDSDLLDGELTIESGRDVQPLVVTLVDRQTSLSGRVRHADDSPAYDAPLFVFHVDPARRTRSSRWIAVVQPDIDGHYAVAGLPPGDYFVGTGGIDWHPWREPERLLTLEAEARRVRLQLGAPVTLDLQKRADRSSVRPKGA
jgi:hypothetical protein